MACGAIGSQLKVGVVLLEAGGLEGVPEDTYHGGGGGCCALLRYFCSVLYYIVVP